MRDTENIEHLSRNIFKKKKYSSCFEDLFYKNIFIFLNSLSNTNFNSNDWKTSKSFQCLLYQFRVLSNSMEFFFLRFKSISTKRFSQKKEIFSKIKQISFSFNFNFQQLIFTFYIDQSSINSSLSFHIHVSLQEKQQQQKSFQD
jgi:hypothetical protein